MLISKKINILSLLNHSVYSTFFGSFDTYVHTPLRCAAPHSMTDGWTLSFIYYTYAKNVHRLSCHEFHDLHFFIFNVKLICVKILLKNWKMLPKIQHSWTSEERRIFFCRSTPRRNFSPSSKTLARQNPRLDRRSGGIFSRPSRRVRARQTRRRDCDFIVRPR